MPKSRGQDITPESPGSDALFGLVGKALAMERGIPIALGAIPSDQVSTELIANHRVGGLLLAHAEALELRPDLVEAMRQQALSHSFAGLQLVRRTENVAEIFRAHGIQFLIFKGVALSILTGREPAHRGAWDVDVLIRREDVPRAHSFLVGEGFLQKIAFTPREGKRWRFWSFRERELSYRKDGTYIDLHWRISKDPVFLPSTESLMARAVEIKCGRSTILTLSPGDALSAAAQHIYLDYCQNLRLLVDFVFLSSMPGVVLPEDLPCGTGSLTRTALR